MTKHAIVTKHAATPHTWWIIVLTEIPAGDGGGDDDGVVIFHQVSHQQVYTNK